MKKFVKLSLVAAVAVAGLTTANAKPLEEAIKDVDVSGTVVYRYNDYNKDVATNKSSAQTNYYKIGLNLSSKVNDDVKLNTRILVADTDGGFAAGGLVANSNDANPGLTLSEVNFAYTGLANTTIKVGKQGLTTPWTMAIDADGNEQTGTGILAMTTVGPVTLAGAYFNQTNLNQSGNVPATVAAYSTYTNAGGNDVMTVGAMGKIGPVSLDAWYLDMQDIFDTYTVGANTSYDLDGIKLGADLRYTSIEIDSKHSTDDNSLLKLTLSAKAGIFDAKYIYGGTDKQGGLSALDNDAKTSIQTWNLTSNGKKDADLHYISVGVKALDSLHVSANYGQVKYQAGADTTAKDKEKELYTQLLYTMSKNFTSYVRFGTYEKTVDGVKTDDDSYRGRLQVQYSF